MPCCWHTSCSSWLATIALSLTAVVPELSLTVPQEALRECGGLCLCKGVWDCEDSIVRGRHCKAAVSPAGNMGWAWNSHLLLETAVRTRNLRRVVLRIAR